MVQRELVLLVEDDDTIAGLVTHILQRAHRAVIRARDGAECVRIFQENASLIGLVILDCRLPDADGLTLCRQMRGIVPDLPVMFTSGRDQTKLAENETGSTAFLPKPFRPVDVERQVNALLHASP
jgi:DNA-binding response OmpR family regulator